MSHTKLSKFIIILIISTVFVGFASNITSQSDASLATPALKTSAFSIQNASISFLSDDDLDDYAFPGNGTADNPWRFENYTLEYSFNSSTVGIHVENITEHLIIRNLTLTNTNNNSKVFGTGIQILADNVVIENVTIVNVLNGIHLEGDNLGVNNTIVNAANFGIKAIGCTSTNITNTNMTQSSYGIFLQSCNQTLLTDNMFANGITGVQMLNCSNFRLQGNF
ncbi:MAG: NosD domain-containing protein, partial [Promethearchaeota archaeon]